MKKKFKCLLLVDDRDDCNYLHKLVLTKMECAEQIAVALNGKEAIEFLKSRINGAPPQPEIIFLDLNMPVMDGWEFLDEYKKLDDAQRAGIIVVMLTTSLNPKDRARAAQNKYVNEFVPKFLDEKSMLEIVNKYFSDYL